MLHYEGKRSDVRNGGSLLIDAGARVRGYASDITRNLRRLASADERFRSLIVAMEGAQQALCEDVRAGRPWAELHHEAHLALSGVLKDENVIHLSPEDAVDSGLSRVFFPAWARTLPGNPGTRRGRPPRRPGRPPGPAAEGPSHAPQHPHLRAGARPDRRTGALFHRHAARPVAHRKSNRGATPSTGRAVDALAPYGGVRVEDNVLVTDTSPRKPHKRTPPIEQGPPVFRPAPRPTGPRNRVPPTEQKRGDGLERRPPVGTARQRRAGPACRCWSR